VRFRFAFDPTRGLLERGLGNVIQNWSRNGTLHFNVTSVIDATSIALSTGMFGYIPTSRNVVKVARLVIVQCPCQGRLIGMIFVIIIRFVLTIERARERASKKIDRHKQAIKKKSELDKKNTQSGRSREQQQIFLKYSDCMVMNTSSINHNHRKKHTAYPGKTPSTIFVLILTMPCPSF
jgi:hypothetical protein